MARTTHGWHGTRFGNPSGCGEGVVAHVAPASEVSHAAPALAPAVECVAPAQVQVVETTLAIPQWLAVGKIAEFPEIQHEVETKIETPQWRTLETSWRHLNSSLDIRQLSLSTPNPFASGP